MSAALVAAHGGAGFTRAETLMVQKGRGDAELARMRYDRTVDALAIELTPSAYSAKTVTVSPGVKLDYDKDGRLITIEVLDASFHMDPRALAQLPTAQDLLTLAEAAAESGLAASTLRVQLNAGRLQGVKRGRDWLVDATGLMNYLESRSPRGRPAASGPRRDAVNGRLARSASKRSRRKAAK